MYGAAMAGAGNIVREKFTASGPVHNLFPLHLYSRLKLFARFSVRRIIIIFPRLFLSLSLSKEFTLNFDTRIEF